MSEGICGCLEKQGSDAQREVGRRVTGGSAGRGANVGRDGLHLHEKKLRASERIKSNFIFMHDA